MAFDPQSERLESERVARANVPAIPPLEPAWPYQPREFDPLFFGLEKTPVPAASAPAPK